MCARGRVLLILIGWNAISSFAVSPKCVPTQVHSRTSVRLKISDSHKNIQKEVVVAYGNEKYGFFLSDPAQLIGKDSLQLELMPPGYALPIDFFYRRKGGIYRRITSLVFCPPTDPVKNAIESLGLAERKGALSSPFYLMTRDTSRSGTKVGSADPKTASIAYIVNRLGEIVWTHSIPPVEGLANPYLMAKPSAPGRYMLVRDHFELVDETGKVLRRSKLSVRGRTSPLSHDFSASDENHIATITREQVLRFGWHGFLPHFTSLLADQLVFWDLSAGRLETRFRSSQSLYRDFDLPPSTYSSVLIDVTHFNSIDGDRQKGFLVSFKKANRILFLDPELGKVLWSVGPSASDTFQALDESAFYQQHQTTFTSANSILVFDSGKTKTRLLELELKDSKAILKRTFVEQTPVHNPICGSARYLPQHKSVVAYYPKCRLSEDRGCIVEFDYASQQERGRLTFPCDSGNTWGRAQPLDSIGTETYLGTSIQS